MRRLALAAIALATLSQAAVAGERRALVIAIDDYASPPAAQAGAKGVRSFGDLRGAVNDALAFRELLLARYGFEQGNVELIQDQQATREGILGAIRGLTSRCEEGDVAVLYYAGHGSQIFNSGHADQDDADKLDQTLVPYDAASGAPDIWDKELYRLLNDLVDTGAQVTAFFDSCHSGSITRGLPREESTRFAPRDGRDAVEVYAGFVLDTRPAPESRGALIFSAAQDFQLAKETSDDSGDYHGIFSDALLKVLRKVPIDEPAERIFKRVRALMQSDGCTQEPVLAGVTGDRDTGAIARALFGPAPEGATGRTAIAVEIVENGRVRLQGGRALGLGAGTELVAAIEGSTSRLVIDEVISLTSSLASPIEGETTSIEPGQLYEVDRWMPPDEAHLKVFVPAESLDAFDELARTLAEITGELGNVELLSDPTEEDPESAVEKHVLELHAGGWRLTGFRSEGNVVLELGQELTTDALHAALADAGPVQLLVAVPPPTGLRDALSFSNVDADSSIVLADSAADAHYVLFGRIVEGEPQYCWVLPGGVATTAERNLALPVRTDWVTWGSDERDRSTAVHLLRRQAVRTGRVRAWLRLEGPPADIRFPWRLALRNLNTDELLATEEVPDVEDEWFQLELVADKAPRIPERRYVYVFAIDSHGKSSLLFPRRSNGPGDNLFPPPGSAKKKTTHPLPGTRIQVQPPYGTDTIVLLSTKDEALQDPYALEWEGVLSMKDKSLMRGGKKGPLDKLLKNVLGPTRGLADDGAASRVDAPNAWSISRMQIVTKPEE